MLKNRKELMIWKTGKPDLRTSTACRPASDIDKSRRKDVDSILRREQQKTMGEYLHILELRMELHGITI
ncbi:hypothetical protein RASY3_12655 [Ruminococcus albus SY3]|uniref:Uncharacterized protein n=1 Tax=Ruminococcus albus SY3 TaxID=1341156 RepID=A0A011UCR9_RUMAL|nr:hypothetical protein [Ruminococcus albus]EXM38409.1 hypothetical protein RASY3_12655 [Ruminococcus albus SY3]